MKRLLSVSLILTFAWSCSGQQKTEDNKPMGDFSVKKTEQEWQKMLTPEQYHVLRNKGTERPGTGEFNLHFEEGVYTCAACDAPLFDSDSKFDAYCGWPSFDKALDKNTVKEVLDTSHGMTRTEIVCAKCGGHLGHVFNDGPTETGMRYCINSVSLGFDKDESGTKKDE